jgi:hypothetical protein
MKGRKKAHNKKKTKTGKTHGKKGNHGWAGDAAIPASNLPEAKKNCRKSKGTDAMWAGP